MSLIPGSKIKQPLTLIAGANVAVAWCATYLDQALILTGTSADPFYLTINRGNTKTAALDVGADAADVQAALLALPAIGGQGGVVVTGAGSGADPYILAWRGRLAAIMGEEVGVMTPSGVTAEVFRLPRDWTGWTGQWLVAPEDRSDPDGYGDPVIDISTSNDPNTESAVILGFVPPAVEGDAFPDPDPTNGNVLIWVLPDVVTPAVAAIGTKRAAHVLLVTHGTFTEAHLAGAIITLKEPPP